MNWETYENMTTEQRLEWHFRFDNPPSFNIISILNAITYLILTTMILVFMSYIIITDVTGQFANYIGEVKSYLSVALSIINMAVIAAIIMIVIEAGKLTFFRIKERLWIKKNGILLEKGWPFNKFK